MGEKMVLFYRLFFVFIVVDFIVWGGGWRCNLGYWSSLNLRLLMVIWEEMFKMVDGYFQVIFMW